MSVCLLVKYKGCQELRLCACRSECFGEEFWPIYSVGTVNSCHGKNGYYWVKLRKKFYTHIQGSLAQRNVIRTQADLDEGFSCHELCFGRKLWLWPKDQNISGHCEKKRYSDALFYICQINSMFWCATFRYLCWKCISWITHRNCENMSHVKHANYVVGHAEILYKYSQIHGPIYRSWAGSRGIVTVSYPEAAEVRNLFV
jgi:ribosomal protein L35AE/L33A